MSLISKSVRVLANHSRVWCRLPKTRSHSYLFSRTQSCTQTINGRPISSEMFRRRANMDRLILRN